MSMAHGLNETFTQLLSQMRKIQTHVVHDKITSIGVERTLFTYVGNINNKANDTKATPHRQGQINAV